MTRTVFEELAEFNRDDKFETSTNHSNFFPTAALPGSDEKVEVLKRRVNRGLPLWHDQDRRSFNDFDRDCDNLWRP